jgi:hypothetical protein
MGYDFSGKKDLSEKEIKKMKEIFYNILSEHKYIRTVANFGVEREDRYEKSYSQGDAFYINDSMWEHYDRNHVKQSSGTEETLEAYLNSEKYLFSISEKNIRILRKNEEMTSQGKIAGAFKVILDELKVGSFSESDLRFIINMCKGITEATVKVMARNEEAKKESVINHG